MFFNKNLPFQHSYTQDSHEILYFYVNQRDSFLKLKLQQKQGIFDQFIITTNYMTK